MGFVSVLMEHDAIGVIYAIGALAIVGLHGSLFRGWKVSQAVNAFKVGRGVDPVSVRKMFYKNGYIQDMAGWAVLLGLFGNAWGLMEALSSGDILKGAGVAFGSTVAGIIVAFLLEVNFVMIRTSTGLLFEDVTRKE
jgi:hypothetical protein